MAAATLMAVAGTAVAVGRERLATLAAATDTCHVSDASTLDEVNFGANMGFRRVCKWQQMLQLWREWPFLS